MRYNSNFENSLSYDDPQRRHNQILLGTVKIHLRLSSQPPYCPSGLIYPVCVDHVGLQYDFTKKKQAQVVLEGFVEYTFTQSCKSSRSCATDADS